MSDAWIEQFEAYDAEERNRREVDVLAHAIYPTMWGEGSADGFVSGHGSAQNTAKYWAREGLRAVGRA